MAMARQPHPWFWKARGAWFVTINGQRICLHAEKKAALAAFHRIMAKPDAHASPESVSGIFGMFLEWLAANRSANTYDWHQKRLTYFLMDNPDFFADDLKPIHVQSWIDKKKHWSSGYKHGVVSALKGAFNWAVKMDLLVKSPIKALSKPPPGRREEFFTKAEFESLLAQFKDQEFRDVLRFMWFTGARPQELRNTEARHVKPGHIVFAREESKGKRRERIVFLVPEAQEIVDRLTKEHPSGPIFRNARGGKWTANSFACRFSRLSDKTGVSQCMYMIRHGYAHYALTEAKLSPEVVATLMGHQDTRQLMQTYGHLIQNAEFMNEAARKASGSVLQPDQKQAAKVREDEPEEFYGGA